MAQGTNQGFEDALAIATFIANLDWDDPQAIAAAFEKYECLRRPMMVRIQQATLRRIPYKLEKVAGLQSTGVLPKFCRINTVLA